MEKTLPIFVEEDPTDYGSGPASSTENPPTFRLDHYKTVDVSVWVRSN